MEKRKKIGTVNLLSEDVKTQDCYLDNIRYIIRRGGYILKSTKVLFLLNGK